MSVAALCVSLIMATIGTMPKTVKVMLGALSSKVVDFYACIRPSKIGVTKYLM